jgi:Uma2 family endonuclease
MAEKTLIRKGSRSRIWMGPLGPRSVSVRDEILVRIPPSAYTLAGFRRWTRSQDFPEYGRISFIGGEVIVDMSQEEITTHALVKTELIRVLASINVEEKLGKVIGDGALIVNLRATVANIPDTVFVSYESLRSGRVKLTPRKGDPDKKIELVGTPDLVVEIVSNSSVVKDAEQLREAYHAAGIPEYWLVDARGEEIVFQILVHRRENYVSAANRDGWVRSRVFAREFRLVREKDPVELWDYRLHARTK